MGMSLIFLGLLFSSGQHILLAIRKLFTLIDFFPVLKSVECYVLKIESPLASLFILVANSSLSLGKPS